MEMNERDPYPITKLNFWTPNPSACEPTVTSLKPFRLYITADPWDTNRFWSFSADRVWPFSSNMTSCDLFTVDTLRLMSKISKSTARGAYLLSFWLREPYKKKRSFILYLNAETYFCSLNSKRINNIKTLAIVCEDSKSSRFDRYHLGPSLL